MADNRQQGGGAQRGRAPRPTRIDGTDLMREVGAGELAKAFMNMAGAAREVVRLSDREKLLILCGAYVASGQRGGFVYHAELGIREGKITQKDLIDAVLINMVGSATFPQVCDALVWLKEISIEK
jgi:alkylhydroperoxidase/carboxymuconolactone decarboxylase family protein YurZ